MRFIILSLICSATLSAEVPLSIGVLEESEQLKQEFSQFKAETFNKIAEDPNFSVEIKNKAIEQLDKIDPSSIDKLANEQGISDSQKQKILQNARKLKDKAKNFIK